MAMLSLVLEIPGYLCGQQAGMTAIERGIVSGGGWVGGGNSVPGEIPGNISVWGENGGGGGGRDKGLTVSLRRTIET